MIHQGTNILDQGKRQRLKFEPKLKQINFLDTRVYERSEGVYYPSVTTILQYMPKNKYFENWLKDVGHNAELILEKAGREGTQVHNGIESLLKGEELEWLDNYGNAKYSQTVWEMILRFHEFWNTFKPKLIFAEELTFSDEHKYAGTADLLVELDEEIWLLDTKSSNSLQKSYDLQLAAYAKALEETRGIKVQRTGILWLKASTRTASTKKGVYQGKGWQIKVVDNIEENFELFKAVRKIFDIDNKDLEPSYKKYPTTLKL